MQNKRIILLLLTIIAVMISINLAFAAHYEYDDLGRLVRVDYSNEQTTKSASAYKKTPPIGGAFIIPEYREEELNVLLSL